MQALQFPHTPLDAPVIRLPEGYNPNFYYHGFPTFHHIGFTFAKEMAKITVFDRPSDSDSIIVKTLRPTVRGGEVCVLRDSLLPPPLAFQPHSHLLATVMALVRADAILSCLV